MKTELENIIHLPAIQQAIKELEADNEAKALEARLSCLDELKAASEELAALKGKAAQIETEIATLDRQREEYSRKLDAVALVIQAMNSRHSDIVRDLNKQHGEWMMNTTILQLETKGHAMRRVAEFEKSRIKRMPGRMGNTVEVSDPGALARAAELETKAKVIEQARHAVLTLQRAPISPQAIERRIREALKGTDLDLVTEQQAGRVEH